ncbi:MAG: Tim44 domain-containing protein [Rickettsiales bacterium]|nr:Tim44 domain-containing protein [Rickettsiales bacterium]
MYIIFLLIITLFLFKMLFNTFGFTTMQDANKRDEAIKKFIKNVSYKEDTNTKETQHKDKNKDDLQFFKNIYNNYADKKEETQKQEDTFDEAKFLKLSEKAIVAILNSFSNNNLEELKNLLSNKMFVTFEKNILENQQNNMFCKTVIVSINEKTILEKVISDCFSSIKLSLKMQQINYIEDNNNEVISGSKDKVNNIDEIWTFVKTNESKYWLLDSIE